MKDPTSLSNIIKLHEPRKLPSGDGIVVSVEEITPDTAAQWLRCNRLNRPVRRNHVDFLAREIEAGLWQLNGQAIVISDTEDVLDGQHRLLAVIESGKSIRSLVVYGVSREAFKTIDTGAVRSGADALSVWFPGRAVGVVKAVGTAVPWCVGLDRGVIKNKDRLANAEVISYVSKNPSIWSCAERICGYPKDSRYLSASVATALYEMFSRKNAGLAARFMDELHVGERLPSGSPVAVLRGLLERDSKRVATYPATVKARMTIKAWNLTRRNRGMDTCSPSQILVSSKDGDHVTIL